MSLSIGIVGLPNVGKSTLFNALTKNNVPTENYQKQLQVIMADEDPNKLKQMAASAMGEK